MKFDLPFSDATITQLSGNTIILSENHRNEAMFRPFEVRLVGSGGDLEDGHFEVVDGVLRMVDRQGLGYSFHGLESRNGAVYMVGSAAKTISRNGFDRITMHEQATLDPSEFGICVSSTVSYAGKTLQPLLESIRKAKFDMAKVVVVVGGYRGEKTEEVEGASVIYKADDIREFNGLLGVSGFMPYWLMIHDTCEMERTFNGMVGGIDIGMNPDVIQLRRDSPDWMGFYSWKFIEKISGELKVTSDAALTAIRQHASVVTAIPGTVTEIGKKDVFGMGNTRLIKKINAVGIRKFERVTGRRTP